MLHVKPNPAAPLRADWSDLELVQRHLVEASEALAGMTADVAKARQIREHNSDLRKRALALAVREFLADESAAAAETRGRASVAYGEHLQQSAKDLELAELAISNWEACMVRWKSAQSVLSSLKAVASNI